MRAPLRFRIAVIGAVVVVAATIALVCRHRGAGRDADAGRTEADVSGVSGVSGEVERSVVSGVRAQLGVEVSSVRCAAGRCAAVLVSGGELPLEIRGRGWRVDGLVIASPPLETYVREALGDLGVATTVDCGPRVRAAHVADRIACALGTGGRAFATIRDATGGFTIEIALDPATAAVREGPADVAALDRMSAALDHGGDASTESGGPAESAEDDEPAAQGGVGSAGAGVRGAGTGDVPGDRKAGAR